MNKCSKYIEEIYLHPKVKDLISKIKPIELQDDLKQEMALALLSIDCKKILKLHKENKLIDYTLKTIWLMGTSSTSGFYSKFKKINNIDFYDLQTVSSSTSDKPYKLAKSVLNAKIDKSPNDAHESIIFNKYVELNSSVKVADYFKIPKSHVFMVVKKTRNELKKILNNDN
mgnify:FL=1|jgi:hypothetical protein